MCKIIFVTKRSLSCCNHIIARETFKILHQQTLYCVAADSEIQHVEHVETSEGLTRLNKKVRRSLKFKFEGLTTHLPLKF